VLDYRWRRCREKKRFPARGAVPSPDSDWHLRAIDFGAGVYVDLATSADETIRHPSTRPLQEDEQHRGPAGGQRPGDGR
jgi:hypothetical protein